MCWSSHPILVEPDSLAHLAVGQDHWRRPNSHALLQTLKSLTDALELCSHQCPRVSDCAEPQLGQVLGGQVLCLPALDDWRTQTSASVTTLTGYTLERLRKVCDLLFAKTGMSSSRTQRFIDSRSGSASTKTASTPMRLNSRARASASSQPWIRASVRASTKMSLPSFLASQAAWMRAYASPLETTALPLVWPHPVVGIRVSRSDGSSLQRWYD